MEISFECGAPHLNIFFLFIRDLFNLVVTYALKESKLVILCISDSFALDKQSMQVYELVKNIIKKNYLLVEFGYIYSHKWLESSALAAICSDVRVIMQDPSRYTFKINEVIENIERQIREVKIDASLNENPPDVFISYNWMNSHDAVSKGTKVTKSSLGNDLILKITPHLLLRSQENYF